MMTGGQGFREKATIALPQPSTRRARQPWRTFLPGPPPHPVATARTGAKGRENPPISRKSAGKRKIPRQDWAAGCV